MEHVKKKTDIIYIIFKAAFKFILKKNQLLLYHAVNFKLMPVCFPRFAENGGIYY